jgi:fluoroquinolone transport system permease protein
MNKLIKLAAADFKIIFRDPSLKVFLFLPLLMFAVFIWFLPLMVEKYTFLVPYIPIFIFVGIIENTQTFSFIISMVLLDEKETGVAKTYGIVPLSNFEYPASRFVFPYIFTFLVNVLFLKIQPFIPIEAKTNITLSFLTGLIVPLYAMGINAIATNRMQGLIYIKAFNMLILIPIAAFFIPGQLKHIFGMLPTHWIFQTVENLANNAPLGGMMLIGFMWICSLTWFVSKIFMKKHFM